MTTRTPGELEDVFGAAWVAGRDLRPSWNVAPTQQVPIVLERLYKATGEVARRIETAKWGLVPGWAKDASVGSRAINARSETFLEKPTFRSAAIKRRQIQVADGYVEWQKNPDGTKTPTYLHPEDESRPLAFAGLYEFWRDRRVADDDDPGAWLMTSTILTRPAADAFGHIHDRMPIVLPPEMWDEWLDPGLTDKSAIAAFIDSVPDPQLVPRVVGPAIGSVRNNGPELIEAVASGGQGLE